MPQLSVVIPVFNEVDTIATLLQAVQAVPVDKEIIVVDDCSTDGTRRRLGEIEPSATLRVLHHETNRGKGAALRTGLAEARGEMVVIQDADLEYDPAEYPRLMQPVLDGKADVVYGSRFAGGPSHRVLNYWHAQGNLMLTRLSNWFTNLYLTDMETCYKLFRREVIQAIDIEEDRFGFEPEITAKLAAMGVRLWEVSISYEGRTYAAGKKIGVRDGLRALWCILKYNARHRRYRREYVSRWSQRRQQAGSEG